MEPKIHSQNPNPPSPPSQAQLLAQSYYARKDIQEAIYNFCKNRETIPNFNKKFFGKRPDALDYPSDLLNYAKKGATSFHCSEELWSNPLEISTDMTPEQLNELKIGWDFLIDIDSKYLDYSKIAARLIIKALEYHGVKNIGIKFSGSKGFHLIIPWKAFPEKISGIQTKDKFPEWPRLIAGYIDEMIHYDLTREILKTQPSIEQETQEAICKKCSSQAIKQTISLYKCANCRATSENMKAVKKTLRCPSCNYDMEKISEKEIYKCNNCQINSLKNPELFEIRATAKQLIDSVDIILVAPRHLFRAPYSLHEKTCLASAVIEKDEIESFNPQDADPLKIQIKNFLPSSEKEEARELLLQALDWAERKQTKSKKYEGRPIDVKNLKITEDMYPPCIQKILKGIKQDGRKRALFILLGFFNSLQLPQDYIAETLKKWNKKNYKPLRDGYIQSQMSWFSKNRILPPNCDKPQYKELKAPCNCPGIKNPINYTIKQAFRVKRKEKNEIKLK